MSISRSWITSRIGDVVDEHVEHRLLDLVGVDALAHRQVALRVEVDARTSWPDSVKATARLSVVVVFATPPFWFANEITCARRVSALVGAARRGVAGRALGAIAWLAVIRSSSSGWGSGTGLTGGGAGRARARAPRQAPQRRVGSGLSGLGALRGLDGTAGSAGPASSGSWHRLGGSSRSRGGSSAFPYVGVSHAQRFCSSVRTIQRAGARSSGAVERPMTAKCPGYSTSGW